MAINVNGAAPSMPLATAVSSPSSPSKTATALRKDELRDFIRSRTKSNDSKEAFYVLDLGAVASLMETWNRNLPAVKPFYAVKCNADKLLLSSMAARGFSFDCASKAEIETVLLLGVSPDRIIFANTCKSPADVKYAAQVGVNLTTFDSEFEVSKISKYHPNCDLMIRIRTPEDADALQPMGGEKFGALPEEVAQLLRAAGDARLKVVGVSFHIGSGVRRAEAYMTAIEAARKVFDSAWKLGLHEMQILNVGGGFMAGPKFDAVADVVKSAVNRHFRDVPGLAVISEPGRFFAESVFTLVANVIGKRTRGGRREYWINEGIYASMSARFFNPTVSSPTPIAGNPGGEEEKTYLSTVYGQTCDPIDTVLTGAHLPELEIDDWLMFPEMGAYTKAVGSNFNGFHISYVNTLAVGS